MLWAFLAVDSVPLGRVKGCGMAPEEKTDKQVSPKKEAAKRQSAGSGVKDSDGNGQKKKRSGFDPSKFSVAQAGRKSSGGVANKSEAGARPQAPVALGMVLEEAGLVSSDMINELVQSGEESAQSLKHSLIQQGLVNEDDIASAVAQQAGMDKVDLNSVDVTKELVESISPEVAKRYRVFPVSDDESELVVAISDPTNVGACDDISLLLGKHVSSVVAPESQIDRFIEKYYEGDVISKIYQDFTNESNDPFSKNLEYYETIDLEDANADEPPVVRFVDLVFKEAVHQEASDIHIEPTRNGLDIRFRIDGVLQEIPSPGMQWKNAITSRLKVMSGMDLAEKRVPQDGRIKLSVPGKALDLRVSCMPSIFGETIVMRILDQSDVLLGLEEVGFLPDNIQKFERLITTPNGVILMTGPTGSGKTTTLNAALSTLNKPETKIITVEDPVEYQIQGINQIQVNTEAELNFGVALRSMLRMSPDVIMVGEIRDVETGEIAIRAALTGHLVFSTLHTNDAPSATIRLIDMGVKPFLVASSIQAVIAQRLIRRICGNCKHEVKVPESVLEEAGIKVSDHPDARYFGGKGCDRCGNTGYRGRTAIHEVFEMDPELRKMVIRNESNLRIKKTAMAHGMRTLRMDGFEKVKRGDTTMEEVLRITQMD